MSESPERYTGPLPEGVSSSAPPPATALEPLVHGQRTPPPGVFTLVEFSVDGPFGYGRDRWVVRAVWQLAVDFPQPLVVDGGMLTMDGEQHATPFAETRVRPGDRLLMQGPEIAWRPGVLEALRALERDES